MIKLKLLLAVILALTIGTKAIAQGQFNQEQIGVIENVSSLSTKNGILIFADISTDYEEDSMFLIVKYVPQIDFINEEKPKWNFSEIQSGTEGKILIENYNDNEDYFFSVGLGYGYEQMINLSEIAIWSGLHTFGNEHQWSIGKGIFLHILALLGALSLFIFGMKTMSEGIQKGTGKLLRKLIGGMTSNKANGIFYGFLTTALVQSSSAITVMVVSFVNTGLLKLKQGIAVIIGANVGTTITAWLIALFYYQTFMPDYALVVFLIAVIFVFSGKNKFRSWGEVLTGIALLFFGLEFLKNGIPDVRSSIEQFAFLNTISGTGIWSVFLASSIGILITIVFQSSIAALALTILLAARGIIPYEMALGMVLGSNIGTTITANIAALSGNVHAKRAARAHLLFNVFGGLWILFLFPYFILLIENIVTGVFQLSSPLSSQDSRPISLALFHTLFNIINSFIVFWLIDVLVFLVVKLVPTRSDEDEVFQLGYFKAGVLSTPELTILEAKKELANFGKIASKMSKFLQQLITETDKKKKNYFYEKLEKYESITDRVEIELTNYLTQTAENDLSEDASKRVRAMLATTNYLERIGDIFYQMSLTFKRKEKERIWFSPEQRSNLQKMLFLVDEAFAIMINNLSESSDKIDVVKALKKEYEINAFRDVLRKEHFESVEKQEYNIKSGIIYSDLFYSCEKIGDLIMNITESIVEEQVLENAIEKVKSDKLK